MSTEIQKAVELGTIYALKSIRDRYDNPLDYVNYLPYHNCAHTLEVIERAVLILRVIQDHDPRLISADEIALTRLAAAFHDIDQTWDEKSLVINERPAVKRARRAGEIEISSAQQAKMFMNQTNQHTDKEVFKKDGLNLVEKAILVTTPFYDSDIGTVIQPQLSTESPIPAIAIALADLGVPGMNGAKLFLRDTDALFIEDNLDFVRALHGDSFQDTTVGFRDRIIAWNYLQQRFALGRQMRLDTEIGFLPKTVQSPVKDLFSFFEETINDTSVVISRRTRMKYPELLLNCGFTRGLV